MKIEEAIPKDFRGCISVKQNGEQLIKICQGYADLANKIPNDWNTKFATASAGKVFAAVGILQLIEQEKLQFNKTIGEILDFDWKAIDRDITVEQLLTHTSGIPDYFDESIMSDYDELWHDYPNYKIRKSSDLIPLFRDKPMMYPRGEKFQYNNTGYAVLGLIIEAVTGMLFDEYLKKNVFEPTGMTDTGYYELDRLPAKCANSYIFDAGKNEYYTNIYSVDVKGTGAGGAFTTVPDVEKFWDALFEDKLISADMLKSMLTIHGTESEKEKYGYGIWLKKNISPEYMPTFEGCDPGASFISSYLQKQEIIITAVSNYGDNVWQIRRDILSGVFHL